MKNQIEYPEEILSRQISGFHQYILNPKACLSYVSQNLCSMLGYTEEELLCEDRDVYASLVTPADREQYKRFLQRLGQKEQTLTLQYHMRKKDGSVIYVNDTAVSECPKTGIFRVNSVLVNVTEQREEDSRTAALEDAVPCGFLTYTCEKQPRITYLNEYMRRLLRFPLEGEENVGFYTENIYFLIPPEERRRFAGYLERVYAKGTPLAGEMTVLRCDGTKVYLAGVVTKCVNDEGEEEFRSVCMDMTERYLEKREGETKRYLKALTDVYDKIFEYDLASHTVKCLYGQGSAFFQQLENIPMQMEEATARWIEDTVFAEDRERVQAFFREFYEGRLEQPDERPPQIQYRALSSEGIWRRYTGIFLKLKGRVSLFCCRNVPDGEEIDFLRSENAALKENIQDLVMHFTDGIAAFEVQGEFVKPLYASDNVCEFFGFTREEWLPMMEKKTSIETFISRRREDYKRFMELLEHGEAEFVYFDRGRQRQRRIKAICSQKSPASGAARYVMLYHVEEGERRTQEICMEVKVFIRTFGYFDVFVGERPIAFRNKKSKELFALLVDRRGGFVTSEEAISFLWEEEPVNAVTLARYRKVALRLKNILEEYGISEVVESVDGKRRIVTERVRCDLYEYLTGKEEFSQLFKGSYLTNYSWGENTLAELTGELL